MTPWPTCCSIGAAVPTGTGSSTQRCLTSSFTSIRISDHLIGVTISRPCRFSSIHLGTDSSVHLVTGCWMRPEPGRDWNPDLATGLQTRLGDYLGSRPDAAAGPVNRRFAAPGDP